VSGVDTAEHSAPPGLLALPFLGPGAL